MVKNILEDSYTILPLKKSCFTIFLSLRNAFLFLQHWNAAGIPTWYLFTNSSDCERILFAANFIKMSEVVENNEVQEHAVEVSEIVEVVEEVTSGQTSREAINGIEETEDQKLKRKRDGDDDESADAKRSTVQSEVPAVAVPVAASVVAPSSIISSLSPAGDSEMISIAPDKVGQIIGTKVCVDPNRKLQKIFNFLGWHFFKETLILFGMFRTLAKINICETIPTHRVLSFRICRQEPVLKYSSIKIFLLA